MKLYQVFGIRHQWLKWSETAEDVVRQVLRDEPEASWEFEWDREEGNVDFESSAKDCEEVPLPDGYKLVKS